MFRAPSIGILAEYIFHISDIMEEKEVLHTRKWKDQRNFSFIHSNERQKMGRPHTEALITGVWHACVHSEPDEAKQKRHMTICFCADCQQSCAVLFPKVFPLVALLTDDSLECKVWSVLLWSNMARGKKLCKCYKLGFGYKKWACVTKYQNPIKIKFVKSENRHN